MTRKSVFTNNFSRFSYSTSHHSITTMFRQRVDGKYHISSGRNVGTNGPSTGTN